MKLLIFLLLCAGVASAQNKPDLPKNTANPYTVADCPIDSQSYCVVMNFAPPPPEKVMIPEGWTCEQNGHPCAWAIEVDPESVQLTELIQCVGCGITWNLGISRADGSPCKGDDVIEWTGEKRICVHHEPPLSDEEIQELREFLSCIHGTQCYALMK